MSMSDLASSLQQRAARALSPEGPIAKGSSRYKQRDPQIALAQNIAKTLIDKSVLIAEAGTGVGKTYAYLVPALLSGGRVIVSTGTRHLQDQLFHRDLPAVKEALNVPLQTALLKGRSNYLCLHHMEAAEHDGRLPSRMAAADLRRIVRFSKVTQTGDRAEVSDVPEGSQVWPFVTSTRDNCLGQNCGFYKDCFVMKARRAALDADVVVVNHHLFFADLALRDEGVAELLPLADAVIFDEAHQLAETATLFFSDTFSSSQVLELGRDLTAVGLAHARGLVDWAVRAAACQKACADFRLLFGDGASRLAWSAAEQKPEFDSLLKNVQKALENLHEAAAAHAEAHEDIARCAERAFAHLQCLARLQNLQEPLSLTTAASAADAGDGEEAVDDLEPSEVGQVRWVECSKLSFQLHATPLSVAPWFQRERRDGRPRAWVFVSATLSVDGDFGHFVRALGLDDAATERFGSPFDYRKQALLVVPDGLPEPNDAQHPVRLFDASMQLMRASKGGAFVLCTSLKMVQWWAEKLKAEAIENGLDGPILVQGDSPKDNLLDRFRQSGKGILIGSASFWEGVDVVGSALRLVIIDRLPFSPPDDPVLAAKIDQLRRQGKDPFSLVQIPRAALQLQQGAGRLIRSETDWGVLVIGDKRLSERSYGRQLWGSLPPFSRTRDLDAAERWMRRRMEYFGLQTMAIEGV